MEKSIVILISEDDSGHYVLLKHRLRKAGIDNEIKRLCDGQETLDFLYSKDPQQEGSNHRYVLLLDIRMPKVDGIEVLRQVRSDPNFENLPIAMVTSSDDPENMRCCRDLGCDAYIVKPLTEDSIETIKELCSPHFASAQPQA
jgi:CheY-like chemotaxis protein